MEGDQPTQRIQGAANEPPLLELVPERAFVLHLDSRARPPRRMLGRVEHVTSGRVTHITSLRELVAFLADVLGSMRA
jgi:hypothetical protein